MTRVSLILLMLFFSITIFAQERIDPGIPSYVNVNIAPLVEYSKDASNPGILGGLAVTLSFNNRLFVGAFVENKFNKTKSSLVNYKDFNSLFQQAGLLGGGRISLGAHKSSGGQYVKRKTAFVYSLQLGGGRISLRSSSDANITSGTDYFFIIKPMIGLERPIFRKTTLGINAGYFQPMRISNFYENSDYSGPVANLMLKFSLFSKKYGSIYIPN